MCYYRDNNPTLFSFCYRSINESFGVQYFYLRYEGELFVFWCDLFCDWSDAPRDRDLVLSATELQSFQPNNPNNLAKI